MITQKIKALEDAKAKVRQLEAAVSHGLHAALASLPDEYGFESVDAFVSAVKTAAGVKGGKATRSSAGGPGKRRKRAKIDDSVRKSVVQLVKAGKTGAEIASELGISLPSVQNIKKAAGLVKASKKTARKAAAPAKMKRRAPKPKKKASKPKSAPAHAEAPGSSAAEASPAPSA